MGGSGGELCPALDLLVTLRGLHEVLFEERAIPDFVSGMRKESCRDPAETLLSPEVQDGLAFIPTLLAPDAVVPLRTGRCGMRKILSEPFLSDDKLAAVGIDVESMDKFRSAYQKFRAGDAGGASGEAAKVASAVKPSTPKSERLPQDSRNASRMKRSSFSNSSMASAPFGSSW